MTGHFSITLIVTITVIDLETKWDHVKNFFSFWVKGVCVLELLLFCLLSYFLPDFETWLWSGFFCIVTVYRILLYKLWCIIIPQRFVAVTLYWFEDKLTVLGFMTVTVYDRSYTWLSLRVSTDHSYVGETFYQNVKTRFSLCPHHLLSRNHDDPYIGLVNF